MNVAASRLPIFRNVARPQNTGALDGLYLRGKKRTRHRPQAISSCVFLTAFLLLIPARMFAKTGGSIYGMVTDSSAAVVIGAQVTLTDIALGTTYRATSDKQGYYSFPNLPVGHYDLAAGTTGFSTQRKTNLVVDTDSAQRVNVVLTVGERSETVTVTAGTSVEVDTTATHLGDVVSSGQIAAMPLNGRSYTDLLAIQPGVAPATTLLPSSVIMAGVTGAIDPSGDLNPGNLSINGQRESSNGFFVNGIDVQEHMNGGTSIIPNLDSIDEFRVLTSNFDPEYGNYNGGIVTVIGKSGSGEFQGSVFEFFRNTAMDAKGYFDPARSTFNQNQFGGTLGGPIERHKLFFFGDYQGTRTMQGISTGYISVPTAAERDGTFDDLTGCVSGPYLAGLLSNQLGTTVRANDPYSTRSAGCTANRPAVFANGFIPQQAWSAPAQEAVAVHSRCRCRREPVFQLGIFRERAR